MLKYATTILLLAWTTGVHAQQPDPAATQFGDRLDVRLVHVDVQVLRKRKPVTDLGVEDFTLLEDGKPVEIAVFSPPDAIDAGSESSSGASVPGSPPTDTPAAETDGARLDTVAVFVDDVGLPPGQRKRALRTIEVLSDPSAPSSRNLIVFRHFHHGRLTLQQPGEAPVEPDNFKGLSRGAAAREQRAVAFAMQEIQSALEFSSCIDARGQLLGIADSYAATASASSEMRSRLLSDANSQSALTQLASETGGNAIFNANNPVKPVLASLEQADATYTLAFYPTHERTGERHVLEVRLADDAKRRTKLRYRRSYVDRTMPQEWADSLRTTARAPELRPASSLPNPLGARLSVNTTADGLVAALSLDTEAVATLMRLSNQSERRLRLWLYVVDPEGRESAAREVFLAASRRCQRRGGLRLQRTSKAEARQSPRSWAVCSSPKPWTLSSNRPSAT